MTTSQLNVGSDSSNVLPQSSRERREQFLEESKKFKDSKGRISDVKGYREAYGKVAEAETLSGYVQGGIGKPVVRQSGESVGSAVERSAVETAELVSKVNPNKDVNVRVALKPEPVRNQQQELLALQKKYDYGQELASKGYTAKEVLSSVKPSVSRGVGRQTIAEAKISGGELSSGRKTFTQKNVYGFVVEPKPKVTQNESGTNSKFGIFDNLVSDNNLNQKSFGQRFGEKLVKDVSSPVVGYLKFKQSEFNILAEPFSQSSLVKSSNIFSELVTGKSSFQEVGYRNVLLFKDKDFQNFGVAGALALVPAGKVATSVFVGVAGYQGYETFKNPTPENYAGLTLASIPVGVKGLELARDVGVRVVGTKVSSDSIFDPAVLKRVESGEKAFPLTSGPVASVKAFESARNPETGFIEVVSASPGPVSSFGQSRVIKVAEGSSSDVGLFVTPKGSGSPYFLKLGNAYDDVAFSLLPQVSRPTASVLSVKGVERIPGDVLLSGVKASREFTIGKGGQNVVLITRGSEASVNPALKIDAGTGRKAFATGELEGVVPPGNIFSSNLKSFKGKIFGFEKYVEVNGRPVVIREYGFKGGGGRSGSSIFLEDYSSSRSNVKSLFDLSRGSLIRGDSSSSFILQKKRVSDVSSNGSSSVSGSSINYSPGSSVNRGSSSSNGSSSVSGSSINYSPGSSSTNRSSIVIVSPTSSSVVRKKRFEESKLNNSGRRFELFVRRRGKFGLVASGESASELFSRGKGVVSGGAGASFKVVSGSDVVSDFSGGERFYKSGRERGVFVQKSKYRISSLGEKSEITQKGLLTLKAKREFGGVFR